MTIHLASRAFEAALQDRRAAILQAALAAFAERGVNGIAVPQIAARAGVGVGTIYRHFENKEALVNELFCLEQQALARHLRPALTKAGEPKALFAELWGLLVSFARQRPAALRFLGMQDHLPYLKPASLKVGRDTLARVVAAVHLMQRHGVFRNDVRPRVLVALVWGSFVNLFKSERDGFLYLAEDDLLAAREACWRMCTFQQPAHALLR